MSTDPHDGEQDHPVHPSLQDPPGSAALQLLLSNAEISETEMRARANVLRNAGARIEDLRPDFLADRLATNHRIGFDVAVELGMDPKDRYLGKNLWTTWVSSYLVDGKSIEAKAWMDHLLHLNVDPHVPNTAHRRGERPDSTLMLALHQSLPLFRLNEICLKSLLDHGVEADHRDHVPLFLYAEQAKADHLATLQRLGFDLTVSNVDGETLLHRACQADVREDPLDAADRHEAHETVEVLLAAGCNPNMMSMQRRSPLTMAVLNPHRRRFNKGKIVQALLEAGADPCLDGRSDVMVQKLLYPHKVSDAPVHNSAGFLTADMEYWTAVQSLVDHGAVVPLWVNDERESMPLLAGLHTARHAEEAWAVLTKNQSPGWEERVAEATITWLAYGPLTIDQTTEQSVAMVVWMTRQGIPMTAWSEALNPSPTNLRAIARAEMARPLDDNLHHRLTTMVEKSLLDGLAQSVATPVAPRARARL